MNVQKTFRWVCTIGTNQGYDLRNQKRMPADEMSAVYQEAAAGVMEETGVYISAVMTKSRTIYSHEWGCPPEGEYSYIFSGSCNLEFSDPEPYRKALRKLVLCLKRELKQATVLLEIIPEELEYFKNDEPEENSGIAQS